LKRLPPALAVTLSGLLAVAGASCQGGRSDTPSPFAPGGGREEQVRVSVENQNFGDATVFARRGGERIRLGSVTGKSEQTFTVRWRFSLPMEFEIQIIGGRGCRIRALTVDPGDRVLVRIPVETSTQPCYSGKTR